MGENYPLDVAHLLQSPEYAKHFNDAYAKSIESRRHGIYENPGCEVRGESWRYRSQDPFQPFKADIDWDRPPDLDSNWSWHHHSLAIIDCHMAAFAKAPDVIHVQRVHEVLRDWMRDNYRSEPADPQFAWGDHTTALRLRAVVQLYAELRKAGYLEEGFQSELVEFVWVHSDRLLRDPGIVRVKHNHALDQIFALALSRQFFPFLKYQGFDIGAEVRRRFDVERDHLIAADGVESENSPAYHMWVPTRIAIMEATLGLVAEGTERQTAERNNDSLDFATWIGMPDGQLPQIGDTAPGKPAAFRMPGRHLFPGFENYRYVRTAGEKGTPPDRYFRLFPASGYLIYRDDWQPPLLDDTHLVLKCGFLADAHRHSDDGTITLSARGEEWLVETGMYGYQAGAHRAHALSPKAHNVSYLPVPTVVSTRSRRFQRHASRWGLSGFQQTGPHSAHVTCRSYMYPEAIYERVVRVRRNEIILTDSFAFESDRRLPMTRFNVPHGKHVSLPSPGLARICSTEGDCIHIAYDPAAIAKAVVLDGDAPLVDRFRTRKYLEVEPLTVLEMQWRPGANVAKFRILLE